MCHIFYTNKLQKLAVYVKNKTKGREKKLYNSMKRNSSH